MKIELIDRGKNSIMQPLYSYLIVIFSPPYNAFCYEL